MKELTKQINALRDELRRVSISDDAGQSLCSSTTNSLIRGPVNKAAAPRRRSALPSFTNLLGKTELPSVFATGPTTPLL
ncbi:unnamed protein product, partial [Protopolystoma xenopodis]